MHARIMTAFLLAGSATPAVGYELTGIRIDGPASVPEHRTSRFSVVAEFDNGWEFDVTLFAGLTLTPGEHASIDSLGSFLAFDVTGDAKEEIHAAFEFGGVTKEAILDVTVEDSPIAGYALRFDGVDDIVRVPRSAALEPTDALTIEVWALPTSVGARNSRIVRNAGHNSPGYILAWAQDYDTRLQLRLHAELVAGGIGTIQCADNVPNSTYIGSWHHFASTYSAALNQARLYVDGVLIRETAGFGPMSYSGTDVYIGNFHEDPPDELEEQFQGQIDEVRIWSYARTQCEIQGNRNRRLAGDEPGLVGYWRFDGGIGQIVADSSPLGNDGVLGLEGSTLGEAGDPVWLLSTSEIVLEPGAEVGALDLNCDGDADLQDYAELLSCMLGPGVGILIGCSPLDFETNGHIDLADYSRMQAGFSGER